MIKWFFYPVILLFCFWECDKENNDHDCILIPETGPCKAAFIKYYFDQTEKKCTTFIYGGCEGVVPFETLEECNKKCPCRG